MPRPAPLFLPPCSWMEVLSSQTRQHLQAEKEYCRKMLDHQGVLQLQQVLAREMRARNSPAQVQISPPLTPYIHII